MSRSGTVKEMKKLAKRYGYDLELRKSGHGRLVKPGWNFITVSLTPSDPRRAMKNTEAHLRNNQRKQER